METVVLTIHLILALLLIGVVLLQKSEGAALLSGGGNMQARGQATALTKVTWILAAAFICTSIGLTVLASRTSGSGSVLDGIAPATNDSGTPSGADLLPPPANNAPAAPPAPDAPAAPPAADAPAAPATDAGATPAPAETAPAETAPAEPPAAPAPATNN